MAVGTLQSTVTSQLTINNTEYNLTGITQLNDFQLAVNQIIQVPTGSETSLLNIGATSGAGTVTQLNYLHIVNRDATNAIRLRFADTGGATFDVRVEPTRQFLLSSQEISASETEAAFASYVDIDTIVAEAENQAVEVEILAGRTQ